MSTANDELICPRFRGQDRAVPANGKHRGLKFLRIRARLAEVEADRGISPLEGAVFVTEGEGFEMRPMQSTLRIPAAAAAKAADQIGDGVAILAHGQL